MHHISCDRSVFGDGSDVQRHPECENDHRVYPGHDRDHLGGRGLEAEQRPDPEPGTGTKDVPSLYSAAGRAGEGDPCQAA